MGLFGTRKKRLYICHNCTNLEEKKTTVCKYCNSPMHEELIDKTIADDWQALGTYIREKYLDGHPDRIAASEKRMEIFSQEMSESIAKHNAEVEARNTPCCPQCGSTAVVIGTRGYSVVTGFIGSGETMNRCGNCGYKWKPRG